MMMKPVQKPHPPIWFAANNDRASSARPAWRAWVTIPTQAGRAGAADGRVPPGAREAGGIPGRAAVIKELYVAPDRRTALADAAHSGSQIQGLCLVGQDRPCRGETFDLDFEI